MSLVFAIFKAKFFFFADDLWASLSHASSKPVADVMETWTKQIGFPVLSVTAEQVGVADVSPEIA